MMSFSTRRAQRVLAGLARDRKAATAVEYGLIIALIVIALIGGVSSLGSQTTSTWNGLYNRISTATGY
ncbi:Flp family type IVb pilin [uncultured Sphingomonas sp.]|uniref:Flp family type IVb pilin n=1 Tax=uncultured Sphingomonas sp. TaxID=158754 RepID=UPI0034131C38